MKDSLGAKRMRERCFFGIKSRLRLEARFQSRLTFESTTCHRRRAPALAGQSLEGFGPAAIAADHVNGLISRRVRTSMQR